MFRVSFEGYINPQTLKHPQTLIISCGYDKLLCEAEKLMNHRDYNYYLFVGVKLLQKHVVKCLFYT